MNIYITGMINVIKSFRSKYIFKVISSQCTSWLKVKESFFIVRKLFMPSTRQVYSANLMLYFCMLCIQFCEACLREYIFIVYIRNLFYISFTVLSFNHQVNSSKVKFLIPGVFGIKLSTSFHLHDSKALQ